MKILLLGALLLQTINAQTISTQWLNSTTIAMANATSTLPIIILDIPTPPATTTGGGIVEVLAVPNNGIFPSLPVDGPPSWPSYDPDSEGTGDWDGEDYGDESLFYGLAAKNGKSSRLTRPTDTYECPEYCLPDYARNGMVSTLPKHHGTRNNVHRRQFVPRPTATPQGFSGFQWPKKQTSTLYNAKSGVGKARCPARCLGTTATPYESYTVETPRPKTRSGRKTSSRRSSDLYPDIPTITTLVTRTAYFTGPYSDASDSYTDTSGPYTVPTDSYPGPYAGPTGPFTGPSLADTCPTPCDPFNPAANKCDGTTSCTTTGGKAYMCACRAGFRADGWNAKDFARQAKVPGLPYVYVEAGQSCNTVCSDQTCSEVLVRPNCL
jgi:hypothetical protein